MGFPWCSRVSLSGSFFFFEAAPPVGSLLSAYAYSKTNQNINIYKAVLENKHGGGLRPSNPLRCLSATVILVCLFVIKLIGC